MEVETEERPAKRGDHSVIAVTRVSFGPLMLSRGDLERHRLIRLMLGHSAAIPCLGLISKGIDTQAQVVEALRGTFATRTVLDGLRLLTDEGIVFRSVADSRFRGIRYQPSRLAIELQDLTLGDFTHLLVRGAGRRGIERAFDVMRVSPFEK